MERRRIARPQRRKTTLDFDDVMYGIHAVNEALAAGEKLRALHVADDRKRDPMLRTVVEQAKALEIPVRFEQRDWFAQLPYKAHQGVVAIGEPFVYASLHDVLGSSRDGMRTFVVLDHVTDPHNLGAIVRTAECAGANAVIIPDRRAAGVNATVRKVAAGATEHLPVVRVGNIADAVRQLKKANVWVAGADAGPDALDMDAATMDGDVALVIGAEGAGLSQLVARECDFRVRIPMFGSVASLNASVAAAILLYEAIGQRRRVGSARSN